MFGKKVYLNPRTGFIHFINVQYARKRTNWLRNHALTAFALAGYDIGLTYAEKLRMLHCKDELWAIAEPYHEVIKKRAVIPFTKLLAHFKDQSARPFIKGR